jgi:hypothetical protein
MWFCKENLNKGKDKIMREMTRLYKIMVKLFHAKYVR